MYGLDLLSIDSGSWTSLWKRERLIEQVWERMRINSKCSADLSLSSYLVSNLFELNHILVTCVLDASQIWMSEFILGGN